MKNIVNLLMNRYNPFTGQPQNTAPPQIAPQAKVTTSEPVAAQSESAQKTFPAGHFERQDIAADGNCFYTCLIKGMEQSGPSDQAVTVSSLRQQVGDYVRDHRDTLANNPFFAQIDFSQLEQTIRTDGHYGGAVGDLVPVLAAHVTGCRLHILASEGDDQYVERLELDPNNPEVFSGTQSKGNGQNKPQDIYLLKTKTVDPEGHASDHYEYLQRKGGGVSEGLPPSASLHTAFIEGTSPRSPAGASAAGPANYGAIAGESSDVGPLVIDASGEDKAESLEDIEQQSAQDLDASLSALDAESLQYDPLIDGEETADQGASAAKGSAGSSIDLSALPESPSHIPLSEADSGQAPAAAEQQHYPGLASMLAGNDQPPAKAPDQTSATRPDHKGAAATSPRGFMAAEREQQLHRQFNSGMRELNTRSESVIDISALPDISPNKPKRPLPPRRSNSDPLNNTSNGAAQPAPAKPETKTGAAAIDADLDRLLDSQFAPEVKDTVKTVLNALRGRHAVPGGSAASAATSGAGNSGQHQAGAKTDMDAMLDRLYGHNERLKNIVSAMLASLSKKFPASGGVATPPMPAQGSIPKPASYYVASNNTSPNNTSPNNNAADNPVAFSPYMEDIFQRCFGRRDQAKQQALRSLIQPLLAQRTGRVNPFLSPGANANYPVGLGQAGQPGQPGQLPFPRTYANHNTGSAPNLDQFLDGLYSKNSPARDVLKRVMKSFPPEVSPGAQPGVPTVSHIGGVSGAATSPGASHNGPA